MPRSPLPVFVILLATLSIGLLPATATGLDSGPDDCGLDPARDPTWSKAVAQELREVLKDGTLSLTALLDLWNSSNPAAGITVLSRHSPGLASRLESLDACLQGNSPALEALRQSDLPPLVVRLLEKHVRGEALLRFVLARIPQDIPQLLEESFPPDQDFAYPELVPLGLESLSEPANAIDAFVLGKILPQIDPDNAFHHTVFRAAYQRLSHAAQARLQGSLPRVSGLEGWIEAQESVQASAAQQEAMRRRDAEFQAGVRRLLEALGQDTQDPTALGPTGADLKDWLWDVWLKVSEERSEIEATLRKLREREWVETEELRTLRQMRLHAAANPAGYAFFAEVTAVLTGTGTTEFRYALMERWAPDDRHFLGFAARFSGPAGLTARDLEILPSVDIEKSSSLHALILNWADSDARRAEMDAPLAATVAEYLRNLSAAEWSTLQATDHELSKILPVSFLIQRRGLRARLYGALVATRFRTEDGNFRDGLLPEQEYAAFLNEYLHLEDR